MNMIPGAAWNPLDEQPEATPEQLDHQRALDDDIVLDQAYLATFGTPQGRRVLEHMEERANSLTGFDPGFGLMDGIANGFAKEGVRLFINTIKIRMERAKTGEQRNG